MKKINLEKKKKINFFLPKKMRSHNKSIESLYCNRMRNKYGYDVKINQNTYLDHIKKLENKKISGKKLDILKKCIEKKKEFYRIILIGYGKNETYENTQKLLKLWNHKNYDKIII